MVNKENVVDSSNSFRAEFTFAMVGGLLAIGMAFVPLAFAFHTRPYIYTAEMCIWILTMYFIFSIVKNK